MKFCYMGNASIEITKEKLLQGSPYSSIISNFWCGLGDSNSWPLPWQGSALTTELNPRMLLFYQKIITESRVFLIFLQKFNNPVFIF